MSDSLYVPLRLNLDAPSSEDDEMYDDEPLEKTGELDTQTQETGNEPDFNPLNLGLSDSDKPTNRQSSQLGERPTSRRSS